VSVSLPNKIQSLFYLVTGLSAILAAAPKPVIIYFQGQPINIVPLLWAIDGSWYISLFSAYLAMHGRFGRIVQRLADRFESFFLITAPAEIAYIVGFVTLSLSNTWVWNHFVPLLLVGIFALYFIDARYDWYVVLRLDYQAVRTIHQKLKQVAELIRMRRKIHRLN